MKAIGRLKLELAGPDEVALINTLIILFKTAQFMDITNDAYKTQAKRFQEHFDRLIARRHQITIKTLEGRILIDEKLVKFDGDGTVRARELIDRWRTIGIGGIVLNDALEVGQIGQFISLMTQVEKNKGNLEVIAGKLKSASIDGLKLLACPEVDDNQKDEWDERKILRKKAQTAFFRAIVVVQEVMSQATTEKDIDTTRTRRVVHSLIDLLNEDENALIELTAIRDFDEYTYVHSVNVCIYALTIGIRLEFDRKNLSNLGFAALFHDMGKVRLPEDLITKPGKYDENDWIQMHKHPLMGAKTVLRNCTFDEHTARAARVAMEHHINEDLTGYPTLKNRVQTNLFSKIVAIADAFDALTSGRVYLGRAIPPDEVLRILMYQMTVKFNAILLKLFVNIVGVYPAGTMILLSSDELAIVTEKGQNNLARPVVKIVGDRSGPYESFFEIDLAAPENLSKQIVRVIDPTGYDIDIKSIILSE